MALRWLAVLIAALFVAACQTSSTPSPTPTPLAKASATIAATSPAPAGPIAVYDGPTLDGKGHVVYLVGIGSYGRADCQPDCSFAASETAKVLATVVAAGRTELPPLKCIGCMPPWLPAVSVSRDSVYFLDGDLRVKKWSGDGHITDVATITGKAGSEVVFSVSPDDSLMAVATVDFTDQGSSLYVTALKGGGRTDVFSSTTNHYWPVGWRGGQVVLATGSPYSGALNQYQASGYALIDPIAGSKPAPVGSGDCTPTGAITASGFACVVNPGSHCLGASVGTSGSSTYYSSCLHRIDWSGKETTFLLSAYGGIGDLVVHNAALSPDGGVIATDGLFWVGEPTAAGYPGVVNGFTTSVPFNTMPPQPGIGFIDAYHVSFLFVNTQTGQSYQRIYAFDTGYGRFKNVYFIGAPGNPYVPGGSVVGQLMGTLPGGL